MRDRLILVAVAAAFLVGGWLAGSGDRVAAQETQPQTQPLDCHWVLHSGHVAVGAYGQSRTAANYLLDQCTGSVWHSFCANGACEWRPMPVRSD